MTRGRDRTAALQCTPKATQVALPLKQNLMGSARCQSTSGSCRYAAPFRLESGRSNARDLCHCCRRGRSNCACRGLFTVGAKGTQLTRQRRYPAAGSWPQTGVEVQRYTAPLAPAPIGDLGPEWARINAMFAGGISTGSCPSWLPTRNNSQLSGASELLEP